MRAKQHLHLRAIARSAGQASQLIIVEIASSACNSPTGNRSKKPYRKPSPPSPDNASGNCAGKAFTSAKYSLSTDSTCRLSGTGNHTHLAAQLFPLLNNGSTIKTHLPAPSSPLVDGVSGVDFPSTDQRGVPRPQGLASDIGAVERQSSDPLIAPWIYMPLILRGS